MNLLIAIVEFLNNMLVIKNKVNINIELFLSWMGIIIDMILIKRIIVVLKCILDWEIELNREHKNCELNEMEMKYWIAWVCIGSQKPYLLQI